MGIPIGFALSVWLFIVAALLFGALVIARWVFALVQDVGELAEDVRSASRRLDQARAGVQTEVRGAQRRLESLRSGRRRPGDSAGRRT